MLRNVPQARPGCMTGHLSPLSPDNTEAVRIFNRLDGKITFPGVIYEMMASEVEDFELMLRRLHAIREHQAEVAAARMAAAQAKRG